MPLRPRGGRARRGWRSTRRSDGLNMRSVSGLTRASRHCEVVAAPPNCVRGFVENNNRVVRGVMRRYTRAHKAQQWPPRLRFISEIMHSLSAEIFYQVEWSQPDRDMQLDFNPPVETF